MTVELEVTRQVEECWVLGEPHGYDRKRSSFEVDTDLGLLKCRNNHLKKIRSRATTVGQQW
jgi:hypothetical protein